MLKLLKLTKSKLWYWIKMCECEKKISSKIYNYFHNKIDY